MSTDKLVGWIVWWIDILKLDFRANEEHVFELVVRWGRNKIEHNGDEEKSDL